MHERDRQQIIEESKRRSAEMLARGGLPPRRELMIDDEPLDPRVVTNFLYNRRILADSSKRFNQSKLPLNEWYNVDNTFLRHLVTYTTPVGAIYVGHTVLPNNETGQYDVIPGFAMYHTLTEKEIHLMILAEFQKNMSMIGAGPNSQRASKMGRVMSDNLVPPEGIQTAAYMTFQDQNECLGLISQWGQTPDNVLYTQELISKYQYPFK